MKQSVLLVALALVVPTAALLKVQTETDHTKDSCSVFQLKDEVCYESKVACPMVPFMLDANNNGGMTLSVGDCDTMGYTKFDGAQASGASLVQLYKKAGVPSKAASLVQLSEAQNLTAREAQNDKAIALGLIENLEKVDAHDKVIPGVDQGYNGIPQKMANVFGMVATHTDSHTIETAVHDLSLRFELFKQKNPEQVGGLAEALKALVPPSFANEAAYQKAKTDYPELTGAMVQLSTQTKSKSPLCFFYDYKFTPCIVFNTCFGGLVGYTTMAIPGRPIFPLIGAVGLLCSLLNLITAYPQPEVKGPADEFLTAVLGKKIAMKISAAWPQ